MFRNMKTVFRCKLLAVLLRRPALGLAQQHLQRLRDGTFAPNETLTREQLVTFLHRYANYKGYNTDVYADIGGSVGDEYTITAYDAAGNASAAVTAK